MKTLLYGLFACLLMWVSCTKPPETSSESEIFRQKLMQANNAFSIKLLQETHSHVDSGNAILSPFNVSIGLSIVANGAEGPTREAIINSQEMLGLSLTDVNQTYKALLDELAVADPSIDLGLTTSLWMKTGVEVKKPFEQINQLYYQIAIQQLNLGSIDATETINNWMMGVTSGNIPQVVDQLLDGDGMYVIGSTWFNGQLKQAFDSSLITQQPFYQSPNQTIPVNMMSGRGMQYGYYSDNEVKIADLPYGNGMFSLSVIMPNGNNTLDDLVSSLSNTRWDMWMNSLNYGPSPTLYLPRFYVAYNTSYKAMLTSFGMGVAFDDNADFSNLTDARLSIANVTQKTIFEVTGKGILPPAEPSASLTTSFTVNKPFLIALRDRDSGRIIMIGKIMNPNI